MSLHSTATFLVVFRSIFSTQVHKSSLFGIHLSSFMSKDVADEIPSSTQCVLNLPNIKDYIKNNITNYYMMAYTQSSSVTLEVRQPAD